MPLSSFTENSNNLQCPLLTPRPRLERVVILVDLDSFYAQCECLRLGFDALQTPLCLMQWNSALAVTYPARDLGIKRGDSWQAVHEKSKGTCHAVHVPIAALAGNNSEQQESIHQQDILYEDIFGLTSDQKKEARQRDLGVRYFANQGKACIERYRVASSRILETVTDFLLSSFKGVVIERASIDEFYIDVTEACYASVNLTTLPEDWDQALRETHVIGDSDQASSGGSENCPTTSDNYEYNECDNDVNNEADDSSIVVSTLKFGCFIAWKLRQAIGTQLGFTLSAGVAPNKLLAKLSASYGKPNGQAVLYPPKVAWLLQQTEIRKCRSLGGKLGQQVQTLLPTGAPTTVGSIPRYVSASMLTNNLGLREETARWLLEYARGIDNEPVQPAKTKVKTITAFKTLNKHPTLQESGVWWELLVQEIVTRVERDAAQNHRYPRFYHVQYHVFSASSTTRTRHESHKGYKASFPGYHLSTANKIQEIFHKIVPSISAKEERNRKNRKVVRLAGIGLCAVDFIDRPPTNSKAKNYFLAAGAATNTTKAAAVEPRALTKEEGTSTRNLDPNALEPSTSSIEPTVNSCEMILLHEWDEDDEALARRLQSAYDGENRILQSMESRASAAKNQTETVETRGDSLVRVATNARPKQQEVTTTRDPDLDLAMRLQAQFSRENRMLEALERREKDTSSSRERKPKTRRIDSFFKTSRTSKP